MSENVDAAQPEKKKKKRKHEEDEATPEASTSKKDKKKRRKEGDESTQSPESADTLQADPIPSKSKKDKKKRKHDPEVAEPTHNEADAEASSSKKDKKKHKKDTASSPDDSRPKGTAAASASAAVDTFLAKHSITIHVPDGSDPVMPVLSFDQLDVAAGLQSAFKGFKEPTPIQACSWPPALQGRDVVGIAETGR